MRLLYASLFVIIQLNAIVNGQECNSTKEFACGSGATKCIPIEWKCDNIEDCENGQDEKSCIYLQHCEHHQLLCKNGVCVAGEFKCDGADDCGDGSDEVHCEVRHKMLGLPTIAVTPSPPLCLAPRFRCSSGQCLENDLVCDGHRDCSTGEDEKDCRSAVATAASNNNTVDDAFDKEECRPGFTMCFSGDVCLPNNYFCDGQKDCEDGSDELNCRSTRAAQPDADRFDGPREEDFVTGHAAIISKCLADGKFHCETESSQLPLCIPMNATCNGLRDCPNGDDESSKCSECARKQCDHTCLNTPNGAQCICQEGYKLQSDGLTCEDEDECAEHGHMCQHYCEDRIGKYQCKCASGYQLGEDGHTCRISNDDNEAELFVSVGTEVRQMPLENYRADYKTSQRVGHGVTKSIDYVYSTKKLFLAIINEHQSSLEGDLAVSSDGVIRILRENALGIGHISADWIGGNIYFTQQSPSKYVGISVCTMNGLFCRRLVDGAKEGQVYRGLVVHATRGLMFWIEKVLGRSRVMVASLDGKEVRPLVDTKLSQPAGLAIDYIRHDIYISDIEKRIIERVNIDTKDRRTVVSDGVNRPYDIAYFNGYLYWSDWASTDVKVQELLHHRTASHIVHSFNRFPYGLAINHSMYQQHPSSDPCMDFDCSWICVLVPKSGEGIAPKCVCPDNYVYSILENTCIPPNADEKQDIDDGYTRIGAALMAEYCDSGDACQNGGTCVGEEHEKTCQCAMPYDGQFCERLNPDFLMLMDEGSAAAVVAIIFVCLVIVATVGACIYLWMAKRDLANDVIKTARIRVDNVARKAEAATEPMVNKVKTMMGKSGVETSPRGGINAAANVNFVTDETMTRDDQRRAHFMDSPSSYHNPMYDDIPTSDYAEIDQQRPSSGSSPLAGILRFDGVL